MLSFIHIKNRRWLFLVALYFITLSIGMVRYTNVFQAVEMTETDSTHELSTQAASSIN